MVFRRFSDHFPLCLLVSSWWRRSADRPDWSGGGDRPDRCLAPAEVYHTRIPGPLAIAGRGTSARFGRPAGRRRSGGE
jgi:hypothetical protein